MIPHLITHDKTTAKAGGNMQAPIDSTITLFYKWRLTRHENTTITTTSPNYKKKLPNSNNRRTQNITQTICKKPKYNTKPKNQSSLHSYKFGDSHNFDLCSQ